MLSTQDPVARAFSAWKMTRRELCPDEGSSCTVPDFATAVEENLAISGQKGCLFDAEVRSELIAVASSGCI